MKKFILLGACLAMTTLALAPVIAQTQSTTTTTTTSYMPTSTVIGSKIKDSRGQDVGVIKDFVLDRSTGCLAYVVLSTGTTGKDGVLTSSTKTVAAPWAVFTTSSEPRTYITRVEREKIYSAPVWESTRIEEYSRTEYLNSVYGYYGVPAPSFNAQLSVGVTNTNTTTVATAAPTAAGSMAPVATPAAASPTVKPMPAPVATPERSPLPQTTAPPSPRKPPSSTRAPAKETSSPSSTREESRSEKKTTDEPAKKSEKASTKRETRRAKTEPESESPSKSTRPKKEPREPSSEPESASTPKEPKQPEEP